ncbi:MAG: PPC domain-containing DNA-binding protein [Candidatus Neomarinimicrobiota bacterium]|tara:strand:- start:618 stop:1043 length:426 start_codon:yes stop_codon:yes gene_type:complete
MQFKQDGNTFIIYIEQDESIMETLTQFCKSKDIVNAQISGIGAIKEIDLGAYDLKNKEYVRQFFNNLWELTSFQGNVILKDNEPFIHAHITMSDHNLDVKGGHLFEAKVGAVGEFILRKIETDGKREYDANIGLFCMKFNN